MGFPTKGFADIRNQHQRELGRMITDQYSQQMLAMAGLSANPQQRAAAAIADAEAKKYMDKKEYEAQLRSLANNAGALAAATLGGAFMVFLLVMAAILRPLIVAAAVGALAVVGAVYGACYWYLKRRIELKYAEKLMVND